MQSNAHGGKLSGDAQVTVALTREEALDKIALTIFRRMCRDIAQGGRRGKGTWRRARNGRHGGRM